MKLPTDTAGTNYFAQVIGGKKIVGVTQATPPHTLTDGQFELTKEEFDFLSKYHLDEVEILVKNIKGKMEGVK